MNSQIKKKINDKITNMNRVTEETKETIVTEKTFNVKETFIGTYDIDDIDGILPYDEDINELETFIEKIVDEK